MRRFVDTEGLAWDIVVGRESWGTLVALFVPAGHGRAVRQSTLSATVQHAAEQELDELTPAQLAELFTRSQPKGS